MEKTIEIKLEAEQKKTFKNYADDELNNFINFECPQC